MSVDEGMTHGVDLDQAIRSLIEGSEEAARAYLKQAWLSRTMDALSRARKAAGLTQAQLAERLGTKQSAVARVENDDDGGISLRRYLDYALACGVFPPDLELVSVAEMLECAAAKPSAPRTGMEIALRKMVQEAMLLAAERGYSDAHSRRPAGASVATESIAPQGWEQSMTGQHLLFQDCPSARQACWPANTSQSSAERVTSPRTGQLAQSLLVDDQQVAA